jgi:hypothetical protein
LGRYPIQGSELELQHDEKEMNMDSEDDDEMSDGTNRYHPTDTSIPGSMAFAENGIKESRREIIYRSPLPVAYAACSPPKMTSPPILELQAIFSPSAPQAEYNVLDKIACETEGAQDLHAPKGREHDQEPIMRRETRSTTRSKNPKIPTPVELSDSDPNCDEENVNAKNMLIINRPYGSSLSPHALLGKIRGRSPLTTLNNDRPATQGRRLAKAKETCPASHPQPNYALPAGWHEGGV